MEGADDDTHAAVSMAASTQANTDTPTHRHLQVENAQIEMLSEFFWKGGTDKIRKESVLRADFHRQGLKVNGPPKKRTSLSNPHR